MAWDRCTHQHIPGMRAEAESQIFCLNHPADGEFRSPVRSWHPRALRGQPPEWSWATLFGESRGVFLLKTRPSGGPELLENSAQMQQKVLVETKGGCFETECQNIFSFFRPPSLTKSFFFFKNCPNFMETLKKKHRQRNPSAQDRVKMGADWNPHFPICAFTWGARRAQGERIALIKKNNPF